MKAPVAIIAHGCIYDTNRMPFSRCGGALSPVRIADLARFPVKALMARSPVVERTAVTVAIFGTANQAGETTATPPS